MKVKTIDELRQPDPRTTMFGPDGLMLDRRMTPKGAAKFVQKMVADCDLRPEVPQDVRDYFETARRLHIYGVFDYEFFTLAADRALFTCELAARLRFIEAYHGRVPLTNKDTSQTATLGVDLWDRFDAAFRPKGAYPRREGWRLSGHPDFDGSFRSLLRWARCTGLLPNEHDSRRLEVLADLRNFGAHPDMNRIVSPVDSARMIADAAALINELWER